MTAKNILYRVCFPDLAGHRIQVSLHIPKPDPEGQELFLPAWIPGSYLIRDFSRQIESLSATADKKTVAVQKLDSHRWRCAPAKGPLHIEYTVYAWDLSVRSAHVDESHVFFNGTSVFLGVHGQEQQPCLVDIQAPKKHKDWRVYTSLPLAPKRTKDAAKRHEFGLYMAPDYDALLDHPVEIGTPQHISFHAHGALHEMVFTGVIPNLDLERIAADAKAICEAQISLFEPDDNRVPFLDSADRYVFMTMVTGDDYGGLEHRSSTALMASRSDLPTLSQRDQPKSAGYQTFLGLVSHEYFHTWNVKRIKPAAFAPYQYLQPNYTELLWVFEGFTSYYDDLMLLRSKVVTEEQYLSLLAKNIDVVHRTGGRFKQSVAESSFDTWTRFYKQDENSPNALVSYYSKGALVALGLDLLLRQRTNDERSLDDVIRLMWQRYGREFYQGQGAGIPEDAMPALIQEATGVDASDFIQRYANGREDVPLQTLLEAQGITLTWQADSTLPSLDARFKNGPQGLQVATAYEDGAAHHAGISANDIIVALDGLRVNDQASLNKLLSAYSAGDKVEVHVFRRDELRSFRAKLGPAPQQTCSLKRLTS